MKAIGEGLQLLNWFTKHFGRKEYHERIEDSLLGTSDGLFDNVTLLMKDIKSGNKTFNPKTLKYVRHYLRQYKANRKKLK